MVQWGEHSPKVLGTSPICCLPSKLMKSNISASKRIGKRTGRFVLPNVPKTRHGVNRCTKTSRRFRRHKPNDRNRSTGRLGHEQSSRRLRGDGMSVPSWHLPLKAPPISICLSVGQQFLYLLGNWDQSHPRGHFSTRRRKNDIEMNRHNWHEKRLRVKRNGIRSWMLGPTNSWH